MTQNREYIQPPFKVGDTVHLKATSRDLEEVKSHVGKSLGPERKEVKRVENVFYEEEWFLHLDNNLVYRAVYFEKFVEHDKKQTLYTFIGIVIAIISLIYIMFVGSNNTSPTPKAPSQISLTATPDQTMVNTGPDQVIKRSSTPSPNSANQPIATGGKNEIATVNVAITKTLAATETFEAMVQGSLHLQLTAAANFRATIDAGVTATIEANRS